MKFFRYFIGILVFGTISMNAFILNAAEKTCYDCHTEAKTSFEKEVVHSPVDDEDCTACHEDHGEENTLKLVAKSPDLCFECHDAEDEDIKKAHQHYPVGTATCYSCHNPHATDNPKLVRQVQHAPFEDRDCESCHDEPKENIFVIEQGERLCYECHDQVGDKPTVHSPVGQGKCNACHSPHASRASKQLFYEVPKLCYQCHDRKNTKENIHPPVEDGDCLSCHNPHSSANDKLLTQASSALCFDCHDGDDDDFKSAHKGYPVTKANCSGCHNPHHSDSEKLIRPAQHSPFEDRDCEACHGEASASISLIAEGEKLCYECHDQKDEGKNVHPPVAEGNCIVCHSPHASDYEKQLHAEGKNLCYQCHEASLEQVEFVHKPVADGECVKCHNPHSSNEEFMLTKTFPSNFYPPYEDGIYELCFSCHEDMVSDKVQNVSGVTDFVRNNENLHARHVNNKSKGRNCKACHGVHGANQKKQIRKEVPFGRRFSYPIKYTKFTDKKGGRCVVGCHKPQVYGPTILRNIKTD